MTRANMLLAALLVVCALAAGHLAAPCAHAVHRPRARAGAGAQLEVGWNQLQVELTALAKAVADRREGAPRVDDAVDHARSNAAPGGRPGRSRGAARCAAARPGRRRRPARRPGAASPRSRDDGAPFEPQRPVRVEPAASGQAAGLALAGGDAAGCRRVRRAGRPGRLAAGGVAELPAEAGRDALRRRASNCRPRAARSSTAMASCSRRACRHARSGRFPNR